MRYFFFRSRHHHSLFIPKRVASRAPWKLEASLTIKKRKRHADATHVTAHPDVALENALIIHKKSEIYYSMDEAVDRLGRSTRNGCWREKKRREQRNWQNSSRGSCLLLHLRFTFIHFREVQKTSPSIPHTSFKKFHYTTYPVLQVQKIIKLH